MNKENAVNITTENPKKTARTPCEVFSRSMGFYRPISNFNIGKRQEFEERNTFKEDNCLSTAQRHYALMKASLLKAA